VRRAAELKDSDYESALVIVLFVALGLPLILFFSPSLSEEFLFLYFGITSALALGAWSTLVLAGPEDKDSIHLLWILFGVAAIISLLAAFLGTRYARYPLDVSADALLTGIIFLFYHAYRHADQYGLGRRVEAIARKVLDLEVSFQPRGWRLRAGEEYRAISVEQGSYLVCDIEISNSDQVTRRIGPPIIRGFPRMGRKLRADLSPEGLRVLGGQPLSWTDTITVEPTARSLATVSTGGHKPLVVSARYEALEPSKGFGVWFKMIEPNGRIHLSRTYLVSVRPKAKDSQGGS
jgi:hypothetical protein